MFQLQQQRFKLRVWIRTRLWAQVLVGMALGWVAQAPSFHSDRWPQFDQADFRGTFPDHHPWRHGHRHRDSAGTVPPAGRPLTAPAVGQTAPATTPGAGTGVTPATPTPR